MYYAELHSNYIILMLSRPQCVRGHAVDHGATSLLSCLTRKPQLMGPNRSEGEFVNETGYTTRGGSGLFSHLVPH